MPRAVLIKALQQSWNAVIHVGYDWTCVCRKCTFHLFLIDFGHTSTLGPSYVRSVIYLLEPCETVLAGDAYRAKVLDSSVLGKCVICGVGQDVKSNIYCS